MHKPPQPRHGDDLFPETEQPATFAYGPAKRPAGPRQRAKTSSEAEQRFWARYGMELIHALLGPQAKPQTVDQWYEMARCITAALGESERERLARHLERAADLLRWGSGDA